VKYVNKVELIGNVGADPKITTLERSGLLVARLSLATTEKWKDKKSNEWHERTEWHTLIAWRWLAEKAERDIRKGSYVRAVGKVTYRKYKDKEGVERYTTEIVLEELDLLEKRPKRGEGEAGATDSGGDPGYGEDPGPMNDEDLPF
jgi:single-strand DNA-binding protein